MQFQQTQQPQQPQQQQQQQQQKPMDVSELTHELALARSDVSRMERTLESHKKALSDANRVHLADEQRLHDLVKALEAQNRSLTQQLAGFNKEANELREKVRRLESEQTQLLLRTQQQQAQQQQMHFSAEQFGVPPSKIQFEMQERFAIKSEVTSGSVWGAGSANAPSSIPPFSSSAPVSSGYSMSAQSASQAAVAAAAEKKNYKGMLQELTKKLCRGEVSYRQLEDRGPLCVGPRFRCEVLMGGFPLEFGEGSNKKAAEQEAARLALTNIEFDHSYLDYRMNSHGLKIEPSQ